VGGGTSDFAIIRLSQDVANKTDRKNDILASSGVTIGGNDFDKYFSLKSFMPSFGYKTTYGKKCMSVPLAPFHDISEWSKINSLYVPKMRKELKGIYLQSHKQELFGRFLEVIEMETGHKILSAVEASKIKLTARERDVSQLNFLDSSFELVVKREDFNEAVHCHVENILKHVSECLNQADVSANDIELVLLTGGTTEIPLLEEYVSAMFSNAEISGENKISSVGLGLGYDALRRFGPSISK